MENISKPEGIHGNSWEFGPLNALQKANTGCQGLVRARRGAIHVQLVVGVEIGVDIPWHTAFPTVLYDKI